MLTRNREPTPGVLTTPTSPPSRRQNRRTSVSPRPVPPWLRVDELSACSNASKMRPCASSGMPTPVSSTSMKICDSAAATVRIVMSPPVVNLAALATRLSKI